MREDIDAPPDTAGCGRAGIWSVMYRCAECGRWFHRDCIRKHFAAHSARPAEPPNPLDVLALARLAAKWHHYALTVHGSLARDLDLVAVPWKEDASSPAVLVEAIRAAVGGWIMVADDSPDAGREGYFTIDDVSKNSPSERPHGRLAWSIYGVLGGAYIDLSVMPLRAAPPPSEAPRG